MLGTLVYFFTVAGTVLGAIGIVCFLINLMLEHRHITHSQERRSSEPIYEERPLRQMVKPVIVKQAVVVEKPVQVKKKREKPKREKLKREKPPKPEKVKRIKPKKQKAPKRVSCRTDEREHSLPYYLFGIGALTVFGHALVAHHINKNENLEERRKDKK